MLYAGVGCIEIRISFDLTKVTFVHRVYLNSVSNGIYITRIIDIENMIKIARIAFDIKQSICKFYYFIFLVDIFQDSFEVLLPMQNLDDQMHEFYIFIILIVFNFFNLIFLVLQIESLKK